LPCSAQALSAVFTQTHYKVTEAAIKITSIYSRREESAKKFAEDYNCERWTLNMEEAIAIPDVDIVCIALPNNLHEAAVMLCCKHKKAVMTTKPLGSNAEEAKRMLLAVEEAGIFNGYLEDLVYTPKFIKANESVKNGALGRDAYGPSQGKHIPARTAIGSGILNRPAVVAYSTSVAIA
jgi:predicted dehydrogenase